MDPDTGKYTFDEKNEHRMHPDNSGHQSVHWWTILEEGDGWDSEQCTSGEHCHDAANRETDQCRKRAPAGTRGWGKTPRQCGDNRKSKILKMIIKYQWYDSCPIFQRFLGRPGRGCGDNRKSNIIKMKIKYQ